MRSVTILGFADTLLMDIAGPAQVFASTSKVVGRPVYHVQSVSMDGKDFATDTGLTIRASGAFEGQGPLQDLIIPGGPGVDALLDDAGFLRALRRRAPRYQRVISVCSGSLLTAASGLLDNRRATTHWERAKFARDRFPLVKWDMDSIFTADETYYCSAGVTTGIDLALSLVEQDHGRRTALSVAREMVVFMQRDGGQSQYSEPLKAQATAGKRLSTLYGLIEADPAKSWTVPEMARFAGVTERTLHRDFKRDFGQSPSQFVEDRRLALARQYLERSQKSVKEMARLAGFETEQKMRRCFQKRLGVLPTEYRERFGETGLARY